MHGRGTHNNESRNAKALYQGFLKCIPANETGISIILFPLA